MTENEFSILLTVVGCILSIVGTLCLFLFLRPKLKISEACYGDNRIKIKVVNKRQFSKAVRMAIEVAVVNGNNTYHFNVDRADFISIPSRRDNRRIGRSNERVFQAIGIHNSLPQLSNVRTMNDLLNILHEDESILRVRVHAYHSLSGFGRYFQEEFKWGQCLRKVR